MKILDNYLAKFFAITAAYYITGKLGLILTTPPVYVAPFWPPAGVALAVILLYGYRYWPAIWLGSFLLSLQIYFSDTQTKLILIPMGNSALIACGTTLQALFGAFLIRRFIKIPTTLETTKDIATLMFLGGPISCITSATFGIISLALRGIVTWPDHLFAWFVWWAGDCIGVMILAPLLLLLLQFDKTKISLRRKIYVAIPSTILFSIAIYVFTSINNYEQEKQRINFENQSTAAIVKFQGKLKDYVDNLYSIERFYNNSQFVERLEFRNFVQYIFDRFYGIHAVEWVPYVSHNQRKSYEEAMQREGFFDFRFKEYDEEKKLVTEKNHSEYFPIYYIEPHQKLGWALGFDLGSDPSYLQTLKSAGDSKEATATSQVALLDYNNHSAILVYKAVYKNNKSDMPKEYHKNLKGFIVIAFTINTVLQPFVNDLTQKGIKINLYDITENKRDLLYGNDRSADLPNLSWQQSFDFAKRKWEIILTKDQEFIGIEKSWKNWLIFITGLLLTAILGMLLLLITGRSDTIERLVNEQVLEINLAEKRSQLLKNIALEAVNAKSVEQVLQTALDSICNYIKWPVGHAFLWSDKKEELISAKIWHLDQKNREYEEFRNITNSLPFAEGMGLPGMVLKEEKSFYIRDMATSHDVSRRDIFKKSNLHSAFAAPIFVQNKVVAVIEFFSPTVIEESNQLTDFIELICMQLGRVIERKQIDNMKNEFISVVSHELRTPLTSIHGSLGLIAGGAAGEISKEVANLINIAKRNSERLGDIINDILDIEKIESGKSTIALQEVEVMPFLQKAVMDNQSYGDKFQIKFELMAIPKNIKIIADPNRLMQVMYNLLSNAAKFSPAGSTVHIGAESKGKMLRFYVKDFGSGIPTNFYPHIFQKFSQANGSNTKSRQGTGLGLNIAYQFVKAMNGNISFESEVGKGTTFFFELPMVA